MQNVIRYNNRIISIEEYQTLSGYPSKIKLSPFITIAEASYKNEFIIHEYLIHCFEKIRMKYGYPLSITSGYRTKEHQAELIEDGYKASDISTHCYGLAFDILTKTSETTYILADIIMNTLNMQTVRVGIDKYKNYKNRIIHLDVAPFYYNNLKSNNINTLPDGLVFPEHWKRGMLF